MVLVDIRNPIIVPQRPPNATRNSLSIIEAAYDLEADDVTWLGAVLREFEPYLEQGLGVYANFYETSTDGSILNVNTPIFIGCTPAFLSGIAPASTTLQGQHIRAAYGGAPCHSLSQAYAQAGIVYADDASAHSIARETGIADVLMVNAWEREGLGCSFAAASDRVAAFPARTASVLSRAARHVAAAQRLRRSVRRSQSTISLDAEAVLDARGAVLHAEGEAQGKVERELLATSTRTLVGAKTRLRDSAPEQVASLWNALVDGRWSLVDSFDRDGKRFLLARRNALELVEPSALTPSERQVAALFAHGHSSKLVAYELGLSESAVSGILRRALRKLHLRSRAELITLFTPR